MPTNLKHKTVSTLLKTLCTNSQMRVPTWTAYNSEIANANPLTLVSTLPVISGSHNLYTAVRKAENLPRELLPEHNTVIWITLIRPKRKSLSLMLWLL